MRNIRDRESIGNYPGGLVQIHADETWHRKEGFFDGSITSSLPKKRFPWSKDRNPVLDHWYPAGYNDIYNIEVAMSRKARKSESPKVEKKKKLSFESI